MSKLDQVINIVVSRETKAVTKKGFGVPLILDEHAVFAERVKYYDSLESLSADFDEATDIYKAATKLLSASSQVPKFAVGKKLEADASYQAALNEIQSESNDWYMIGLISRVKADILDVATWTEAQKKMFIACTQDVDVPTAAATDVATAIKAFSRSGIHYSKDASNYPEFALMGQCLPFEPGTITWAFKSLNGIPTDNLTATELTYLEAKRANYYIEVGGVGVTFEGMTGKEFIDVIRTEDWTVARMQENIFSLLINSKKVPYTNKGVNLILSRVQEVLDEGVLKEIFRAEPRPTATARKVEEISVNDRALRFLPDIDWSAELAGAVHKIKINGTLKV